MPMKLLVINCSLNVDSHAYLMAEEAIRQTKLPESGIKARLVDLRELQLPVADASIANKRPDIRTLEASIERTDAVLLAFPLYHYDVGAAAKNLLELTGRAWKEKVVGFMCTSSGTGGRGYMAVMNLVAPLLLEYRCVIAPKIAFARSEDFSRGAIVSGDVPHDIKELLQLTTRLAAAIDKVNEDADHKRRKHRIRL